LHVRDLLVKVMSNTKKLATKNRRVGEGRRRRLSPRQTGRADFPHPAFPKVSAQTCTWFHRRR
jgi:hypothetical protein